MKLTVLGTELIDYTSKKTGKPVKGISLHCALKQQGVDGQAVESVFISDALDCYPVMCSVTPGTTVDVEYNRRGYVADASVVAETKKQG